MDTQPSSDPGDDFDQTIKFKVPGSGMTVFNRYKLQRVLGRGGMGIVWLADDLKLERPVALKFLPSLIGLDPAAVKELKIETRRGLELSHPNIVRIYDFVDDEDSAAIAMEFVDGKTLSELRATTDHGVFTADQVAKWLPGVCMALDYAHFQRKVIHRDLKPANIMAITGDDTAKIADFGIARSISDTMQRLSVAQLGVSGTLPYMSPQQAMGEAPSPTDDIYSLGATIYELLTGKPPFYRGDISSQITSIIPVSIMERREELDIKASDAIPKEWEVVIAACLNKNPSLRPPSAGKLLELLSLKGGTNSASFSTEAAKGPALAKSHLLVYVISAVAVLTVGAAIFLKSAPPAVVAAPVPAALSAGTTTPAAAIPAPPQVIQPPVLGGVAVIPVPPPATVMPSSTTEMMVPPVAAVAAPVTHGAIAASPATAALPLPVPAMVQPPVSEPPEGYWPMAAIFPTPPQASYSENGRRRLLYEAQGFLKGKDLYNSSQDGREGNSTHNAIVLFQVKNGLLPNGFLDGPTLAAMSLSTQPDDPGWSSPTGAGSSGGKRSTGSKEGPNMLQRARSSIGRLLKKN